MKLNRLSSYKATKTFPCLNLTQKFVAIAIISLLPTPLFLTGCDNSDAVAAPGNTPSGFVLDVFDDRSDHSDSRQKLYLNAFRDIVDHCDDFRTQPSYRLYGFSNEGHNKNLPLYFNDFTDPEHPEKLNNAFSMLIQNSPGGKGTHFVPPLNTLLND